MQRDLWGRDKRELAIERIKTFCGGKKVLCAFSGGKDSQAVYHLLQESGIDFTAQYSITRFEPPELLAFIRKHYPEVVFRKAYKKCLIDEIAHRGLPNRCVRWCCDAKHKKTPGYDIAVIGIRWDESPRRRDTWRMIGITQDKSSYLCPICDWTSGDVWEYLGNRPHCSLYDEGFKRIGCVCCPLVPSKILQESIRWPKTADVLRKGAYAYVKRMSQSGFLSESWRKCTWVDADNPKDEYWQRWIATGQVCKPIGFVAVDEDQCLFAGSGFSESDGAQEE